MNWSTLEAKCKHTPPASSIFFSEIYLTVGFYFSWPLLAPVQQKFQAFNLLKERA
jgi:hypothetical protein